MIWLFSSKIRNKQPAQLIIAAHNCHNKFSSILFIHALFFRASGEDVRLMLWDTAGQEEFDAITKAYYRGAQACVIAFSTTDHASFEAVKKWKRKVEDECGHVPMVLVQNKIDLLHESQIDRLVYFDFTNFNYIQTRL